MPETHVPPQDDNWPPPDPNEAHPHHGPVGIMRRIYAVIPIVVVLFLSYQAFRYLVVQLLIPYEPPRQVAQIPTRLTAEVWRSEPEEFLGVVSAAHPRTPLAHYHHIDGWFQPDPVNDCTRSGCHTPMSHSASKEVRAFLNMHATSIHCGVCHMQRDDEPLQLVWYDLHSGDVTDIPALIRAYAWLHSAEGVDALTRPTLYAQQKLVALLNEAVADSGGDPSLQPLVDLVAGPRYTSDEFVANLREVRERLPLHFRGEYGAKLALRDSTTGRPVLRYADTQAAIQEFLRDGEKLDDAARKALLDKIHPQRRTPSLQCHDCHQPADSLLNLAAVGYPAQRIEALYRPWIFRAIEHIASGQPLHLPEFVLPQSPETTPTNDEPAQP